MSHGVAGIKLPVGMCAWSAFGERPDDPVVRAVQHALPHAGPKRPAIKSERHHASNNENLAALLADSLIPWSTWHALAAGELLTNSASLQKPSIWKLWSRLAALSSSLSETICGETPDQLLVRCGELPFLLGLLLEPWREARALRERGRRWLIKELIARTDSDGTPHAELLSRLPLWLAPLIRATLWAKRFAVPLWSEDDLRRLTLALERAIPLCRPSGQLALSNGYVLPALPLFDVAAKTLSIAGPAEKLLRQLRQPKKSAAIPQRKSAGVQEMPSAQSDWARFAMLRSDWSSHADSLAVSHHQPAPVLDVAALGRPVLHGAWGWELQIGDAVIEAADEWSCSCWFSDPDADYLELQMKGPGSLRIERQLLLSRQDHFLLLADCVHGAESVRNRAEKSSEPQRIDLRSRLPLAGDVLAEHDVPTREIRLKIGKQTVRVFPLALPQERLYSTPHRCDAAQSELVLHQVGQGHGLYAPLLFDWHPARTRSPAVWRNLTVTEAGKTLGRDRAAGYRLQLGKYQLLMYRSLSSIQAARAVLGHHTWHETVVARFDTNGDVDPLVKVDA